MNINLNMNINLIIIYLITILEVAYAYNTYTRIDLNTDILFRIGKRNLIEVIINEFKTVLSSIFSILLLTIPFYVNSDLELYLSVLIYLLMLFIYFKLRWINKKLKY